jgi:hypothetical protein
VHSRRTVHNLLTQFTVSGEQTIVTVVLKNGDTKETIPIHKNFIFYYSPYFNALFNGRFVEGETQRVELEDGPPAAFNLFVNWLYTQEIRKEFMDLLNDDNTTLVEAWILADRFMVPRLQNQLMGRIRCGGVPVNSWVRLCEKTSPGSKLRSFIVDRTIDEIIVSQTRIEDGVVFCKSLPHEMAEELLQSFLSRVTERTKLFDHPRENYEVKE